MKRLRWGAVVLTIAAVAIFGGSALASGGTVDEQRGFLCGVLDGNGSVVLTTDSYFVIYSSGKAYLRCEATGVANPTGGVVNWNFGNTGLLCGMLSAGSTDTWRNRVGSEGTAQLTCTTYVKSDGNSLSAQTAGGAGLG